MSKRVAIIGGGIFGCTSALALARAGHEVTLFEKRTRLMQGASRNNHNRLHLGLHYPRDMETARQCLRGYLRFISEFKDAVAFDHPSHYYIASEGSLTSPEQYIHFLDAAGIPYQRVDVDDRVQNCALAVRTWEAVYDSSRLEKLLTKRLRRAGVDVHLETEITTIRAGEDFPNPDIFIGAEYPQSTLDRHGWNGYQVIVNCAYDQQNKLSAQLGLKVCERQYEYTVVPIVEIPEFERQAITIMDGPFCSIQPYGLTDRFLLYHAKHAVLRSHVGAAPPADWPPMRASCERQYVDDSAKYIPALTKARVVGWLDGPRMVLAQADSTDARPSMVVREPLPNIKPEEGGYITVFAGKVDHSIWVADDVVQLVGA